MKGLSGKVAIVTGGAASIGRDITAAFVGAGVKVMVAARTAQKGEQIMQEFGDNADFQRTDITSDADLDRLVKRSVERFGRLDFVVNNACSYVDSGAASTRAEWLQTLDTNVVSGAILVQKAIGELAKTCGVVVNLSSISAYAAQTGRWTYPTSKAAILQLTRLQALDYAAYGVRVNSLVAGWTWSDPIEGLSGGDQARADEVGAEFHILGRVGRGSEVADGVLFLCSDHASFVTGGELKVEGGYLALGPEQAKPAIALLTGGQATVR